MSTLTMAMARTLLDDEEEGDSDYEYVDDGDGKDPA